MTTLVIEYSDSFDRQLKKAPVEIKKAFKTRILIFNDNPFNPALNNHRLKGKMNIYRSVNITGDWRALYTTRKVGNVERAVFGFLGTHSQLYR